MVFPARRDVKRELCHWVLVDPLCYHFNGLTFFGLTVQHKIVDVRGRYEDRIYTESLMGPPDYILVYMDKTFLFDAENHKGFDRDICRYNGRKPMVAIHEDTVFIKGDRPISRVP